MLHPNARRPSAEIPRPRAALDGRCTLALVALLSLASLSVAATTGAASRDHAERLTADARP